MTFPDIENYLAQEDEAGMRLDVYLSQKLADTSRSHIAKLAQDGCITVNGKNAKPAQKLKAGDAIAVIKPEAAACQYLPENIPLDILFEDDDILVINKPPGLVVHPAPGHSGGTVVNAVLYHCPNLGAINGEIRPGIVHRLDQDTSGVMVIAKNNAALENLSEQFKSRQTRKTYLALVLGNQEGEGTIDAPIGRAPADRKKMSTHAKHGREATTKWRALKNYNGVTLLKVRILTGRTHQIRVHCAHMRHPVVGDLVYGVSLLPQTLQNYGVRDSKLVEILKPVERQMLHAYNLRFNHPATGVSMGFTAPLPQDMQNLLNKLETYLTEEFDPDNEALEF